MSRTAPASLDAATRGLALRDLRVLDDGRLWRESKARVTGSLRADGYVQVGLRGKLLMAHRLVWLLCTGEWPLRPLDHINGNRADNRFCNLRLACAASNKQNSTVHVNNRLGIKGVRATRRGFQARIQIAKKPRVLGTFPEADMAELAYLTAADRFFGAFACGSTR